MSEYNPVNWQRRNGRMIWSSLFVFMLQLAVCRVVEIVSKQEAFFVKSEQSEHTRGRSYISFRVFWCLMHKTTERLSFQTSGPIKLQTYVN